MAKFQGLATLLWETWIYRFTYLISYSLISVEELINVVGENSRGRMLHGKGIIEDFHYQHIL